MSLYKESNQTKPNLDSNLHLLGVCKSSQYLKIYQRNILCIQSPVFKKERTGNCSTYLIYL